MSYSKSLINEDLEKELTKEIVQSFISSEKTFCVDFEQAWRWSGYTTKHKAKSKLINNFVESVDFSILQPCGVKIGRPTEEIQLTSDCFKQFCMLAQTEQGKKVRLYFLECEKELKSIKQKEQEPKTQAQILLESAQLLVNLENEQKLIKAELKKTQNKIDDLFMYREKNMKKLFEVERSAVLPLQRATRSIINELVRVYSACTGIEIQDVWNNLYKEFLYRYKVNIKTCAKNRGLSNLDYVESIGKMNELFALASYILQVDGKGLQNIE